MSRRTALHVASNLLAFSLLALGGVALAGPREVRLQPGAHTLVLTAELPEGYAFNADAPQHATHRATGLQAQPPELSFTDRSARISIPLTAPASGQGELTVNLTLYYCAVEKESVCLMDRRTLVYAVSTASDGQAGTVTLALPPLKP